MVATTVVLVAVFVPISLLEGNTGRLFSEFALSLAGAVVISTLVALTLTPAMCAAMLRGGKLPPLTRAIEAGFVPLQRIYRWILEGMVRQPLAAILLISGESQLPARVDRWRQRVEGQVGRHMSVTGG